jgi:hypothetical protein
LDAKIAPQGVVIAREFAPLDADNRNQRIWKNSLNGSVDLKFFKLTHIATRPPIKAFNDDL